MSLIGGASNHPTVSTGEQWFRQIEKRMLHLERQPRVTKPSDLLGPGIAPTTAEVKDWSADTTLFNGLLYSNPGSFNSPDGTRGWIGVSLCDINGYGVQVVWDYQSITNPPPNYVRRLSMTAGARSYGPWTLVTGGGGGGADLSGYLQTVPGARSKWVQDFTTPTAARATSRTDVIIEWRGSGATRPVNMLDGDEWTAVSE